MADPTRPAGKPRRLWRIVLVISLALNLAVAGVVGGALLSGRSGDGGPRAFELGLGPLTRTLAPSERREIGRSLRRSGALRQMNPREGYREMAAAIGADPFDVSALQAAMTAQSRRFDTAQDAARAAFVAMITEMTPERRAELAAALLDDLQRPRGQQSGGSEGSGGSGG